MTDRDVDYWREIAAEHDQSKERQAGTRAGAVIVLGAFVTLVAAAVAIIWLA